MPINVRTSRDISAVGRLRRSAVSA